MPRRLGPIVIVLCCVLGAIRPASAQRAIVTGVVRDQNGGVLPGASVELASGQATARRVETDARGTYRFEGVPPGTAVLSFALVNFGVARRDVDVPAAAPVTLDVTLILSLSADVTVSGKSTFSNLADGSTVTLGINKLQVSYSGGDGNDLTLTVVP